MAFCHQSEDIVVQREVFQHYLLSYSMLEKMLTLRRYKTKVNSVKSKAKTAFHGLSKRQRWTVSKPRLLVLGGEQDEQATLWKDSDHRPCKIVKYCQSDGRKPVYEGLDSKVQKNNLS